MSSIRVLIGKFGRIALVKMCHAVVEHAHHHGLVLIIKCSGGDATFSVRGETRRLTDDTAVLINAWEPHCFAPEEGTPATVGLALYIEQGWLKEAGGKIFGGPSSAFFANRQARISPHSQHLVQRMIDLLLSTTAIDPDELDKLLFLLIVAMVDGNGLASPAQVTRPVGDFRIRRAVGHLRDHIGTRLAVDEIASVAGLSRPHFFTLFRRCTGLTPGMFFNSLRNEEAIRRLSASQQSIGDLAFDLGFEAQSNFTRFFRQHQGVAPAEFRKVVDLIGGGGGGGS